MDRWTRRGLLRGLTRLPLLAGLTALAAACGGGGGSGSSGGYGGSSGGGGGGSTCDGITPTMDQHMHPTCLTMAELQGGNAVTLSMAAGSTGHTHTVTLSAAEVQTLRDTTTPVTLTSSNTGHTHQVTFT